MLKIEISILKLTKQRFYDELKMNCILSSYFTFILIFATFDVQNEEFRGQI